MRLAAEHVNNLPCLDERRIMRLMITPVRNCFMIYQIADFLVESVPMDAKAIPGRQ